MLQLIGRRGPVPRLVLDYAHEDGADAEIREAIGALMASDIKAARPSTAQASHRLVLIHPPGWRQGEAAPLSLLELRFPVTRTASFFTQSWTLSLNEVLHSCCAFQVPACR